MSRAKKPSGRPKRRSRPDADRTMHRRPSARWRRQRLFFVAVEGERTEVDYLRRLQERFGEELDFLIRPLSTANGMTPTETVEHVLANADAVTAHDADPPGDPAELYEWERRRPQLWALFDRDADSHHDVPAAFRAAREAGVNIGYSNPSFELWLLLHFTDVTDRHDGRNGAIIGRLRECDGFAGFDGHSGKGIDDVRFAALMPSDTTGGAHAAARRARRMADGCFHRACPSNGDHHPTCDPTSWDPYTSVWRLLSELGILDD